MNQKHSLHHSLVRSFDAKAVENEFGLNWVEGETFVLVSPEEGHRIAVTFTVYPEHPDVVRVRSTNWRAEHEPRGLFSKRVCRAFYARLMKAGFVVEKSGQTDF